LYFRTGQAGRLSHFPGWSRRKKHLAFVHVRAEHLDADLARVASLHAALRSGDAALAANRLGYKVGMRTGSDVLDALARRSDAERELDAARYAVLLDGLRLRQAAGTLSDADLQAVDALLRR